jgi:hypothetical protein
VCQAQSVSQPVCVIGSRTPKLESLKIALQIGEVARTSIKLILCALCVRVCVYVCACARKSGWGVLKVRARWVWSCKFKDWLVQRLLWTFFRFSCWHHTHDNLLFFSRTKNNIRR